MRKFLVASLAVLALHVATAEANESYLGVVTNADAGSGLNVVSNLTTAVPFVIAPNSLLSVQPSANAYVCIDALDKQDAGLLLADAGLDQWVQYRRPSCTSANGVRIDANVLFPTSCGSAVNLVMPDGGQTSCTVACVPVSGASAACGVWNRRGNEGP